MKSSECVFSRKPKGNKGITCRNSVTKQVNNHFSIKLHHETMI